MPAVTYKGPIVDPHHHLWDLEAGRYPWLTTERPATMVFGDTTPLARNYLVEDYRRDAEPEGVVRSVHIEAGFDRADPVAETAWLQALADPKGFPHALVAHAQLGAPDVERTLEAQSAFPSVRGIRHVVSWHKNPALTFLPRGDLMRDPDWRRGFSLLRRYGLSFDLLLFPSQLPDALALARDFPDTQIILNHTGSPVDRDEAGLAAWRDGMKALAAAPNVAVKISDLPAYDHDWTVDSIRPFVLSTIEWFGPERCMFASDFPVAGLHGSFKRIYDGFRTLVADMSPTEQRALFHDNAMRIYRLG